MPKLTILRHPSFADIIKGYQVFKEQNKNSHTLKKKLLHQKLKEQDKISRITTELKTFNLNVAFISYNLNLWASLIFRRFTSQMANLAIVLCSDAPGMANWHHKSPLLNVKY